MENESLMELNVPECWYEHDENGNRVALSFLGCIAVMSIGIELAYRIAGYLRQEILINK